jgi:hypothetical protein
MAAHSEPLGAKKRLDSWKEIAAFFDRDERTVKRWEKERGLPVYRVPGTARGGVFAYVGELTEWLTSPSSAPSEALSAGPVERRDPVGPDGISTRLSAEAPAPKLIPPPSQLDAARTFLWLVPLVLIAASFLVLSFSRREPRFKNALAAPHPPSAEAQDFYLKGRYYFEKRTPSDLNRAVDFFTQAIVQDPNYAAPYVGLADSYNLLREYSAMSPQEAFPRARAAASKAVELDPNSAEAHNSQAFASFWGFFEVATADREFKRAIELDPNLPRAHHWYATFLAAIQRNREALAEIERARQLDPSSTPILADKGLILAVSGKREEARILLTQLADSQPEFIPSHRYLAEDIYLPEADYPGYLAEMATVALLRHDPKAAKEVEAEQKAYKTGGPQALLQQRLAVAQDAFDRGAGSAFEVAAACIALGQKNDALKYLQIAYQRHDLQLTNLTAAGTFQSIHQEPEFRDLVARVGLPPLP